MKDKYWLMGPIYDALSFLFAGNSIYRCKCSQLTPENLKPGDKVLFAGVGHGKEAIYAAEMGAEVTVVDLSEAMLNKFREALEKTGKDLKVRIVHSDIMKFEEYGEYDMVAANFFFNLFPRDFLPEVMKHLARLGKEEALYVVSDFAIPEGNILTRFIKNFYWYFAITIFWITTGAAMHTIYPYQRMMEDIGLRTLEVKYTSFLGINFYYSILGKKPKPDS